MIALKELQDSLQRAIVDGDDAVLSELLDTSKEKRETLLGVYRNAYVLRLIEILQNDYEKLHKLLGDDQFAEMARAYIKATPSHTTSARWYGLQLPEFLGNAVPYRDTPALADLARLELALYGAFDAEDAAVLTMEDLAGVAPEDWGALTFTPHPSVTRFHASTNVTDIWQALNKENEPPAAEELADPAQIAVYRSGGTATFRTLAADEAMMWDEAAKGVSFSVLCEMLATFGGEDDAALRAASYLKGWVDSEMLAAPAS